MLEPNRITIRKPGDWHLHLRDGDRLRTVLPYTVERFGRAVIMPNLQPPVCTANDAADYRKRIYALLPSDTTFCAHMTGYLTDNTDLQDLIQGFRDGIFIAAKLYPANATNNSAAGVKDMRRLGLVLEAMERHDMPLLIHCEVTDPTVDVFDREAVAITKFLTPIMLEFPRLRIVFEHITTLDAVAYVRKHADTGRLAATITAHHLLINRNAIFAGGIRPHAFCLPVAKREQHRKALAEAATSGQSCFFLGTDSAPHLASAKESACGCAGIFTAPAGIELYAEVFDKANRLDRLEQFASINGANFYNMTPASETLTLVREHWKMPANIEGIVPFRADEAVEWQIVP